MLVISGGRDQEDCALKPAPANSSSRPYLKKKTFAKKKGLAPSSSPSTTKNKQTKKKQCKDCHMKYERRLNAKHWQ
jgi:hypothetical protein